jgi:O-acetylserine/cysteine efflux transporter
MPLPHLLLALAVAVVWGFNYVAIGLGLHDMPPLFLAGFRFLLAAVPLVFLRPLPRVPMRLFAGYTFFNFVVQFMFLFCGIKAGLPAGTASMVMQLHVFITMGLALAFRGEHPRPVQWLGAAIGFAGVAVVGLHMTTRASLLGFGMGCVAMLGWALGNDLTKRIGPVDLMALLAWSSLCAAPVLLGTALALEGPAALGPAVAGLFSRHGLGPLLYQAYGANLFGFWAWAWLLRRHPAAVVAPWSMLVPVVSMIGGALCLGEPLTPWKCLAGVLVLGGLSLNQMAGASLGALIPGRKA